MTTNGKVVDLRLVRLGRGLTKAAAAREIGIDRHTLDRVERGQSRPQGDTAFKIATFYGLEITEVEALERAA